MERNPENEFHATATMRTVVAHIPELPDAERRVANAIRSDPASTIHQSVGQLADRADASTATVVRLARRLGYEGFTAFKLSLAHEAGRASSFGHPTSGQVDAADSILDVVIQDEVDALEHARDTIDRAMFDEAVKLLAEAPEIMFVGVGTSVHLSQLAAYRFSAIGIATISLTDVLSQHLRIDTLQPNAVVVAISHTGASNDTCMIAEHAKSRDHRVIGLTTSTRSPLADIADPAITTGHAISPHRMDNFEARTVHVAILSALHAAATLQRNNAETSGTTAARLIAQHQR